MTFSPVVKVCVAKHNKEYHRAYLKTMKKKNNIDNYLDESMHFSNKPQDIEKKLQMLLTKKNLDSKSPLRVSRVRIHYCEKLIYW